MDIQRFLDIHWYSLVFGCNILYTYIFPMRGTLILQASNTGNLKFLIFDARRLAPMGGSTLLQSFEKSTSFGRPQEARRKSVPPTHEGGRCPAGVEHRKYGNSDYRCSTPRTHGGESSPAGLLYTYTFIDIHGYSENP